MKKQSNALLLVALTSSLWAASCGKDSSSGDGDGDGSGGEGGATMTQGGTESGGGSGASTPDPDVLSLVFQTPESGSENVAAHEPIVLGFSSALDESTVDGSLRVRADGEDVDFSVTVQGRNIEIILDEVPSLPARISVTISRDLAGTNGSEFPGDSWNFTYPLWQRPERNQGETDNGAAFAALPDGSPVVVTGTNASLEASVYRAGEWEDPVELPSADGAGLEAIGAIATDDGALVAWTERVGGMDSIHVASFDGEEFGARADSPVTASSIDARLGVSPDGNALLVTQSTAGQLEAHQLSGDSWTTYGATLNVPGGEVKTFDLAGSDDGLVVALVDASSDILVYRWNGSSWDQLGDAIDRVQTGDDPGIDVAADGASVYLAYQDGDYKDDDPADVDGRTLMSHHMLVAQFDGSWNPVGSALDLEMNNEASFPSIVVDAEGTPLVAWMESLSGIRAVIAARLQGPEWNVLGERALDGVPSGIAGLDVSVDPMGNILVAAQLPGGVDVARFNSSPDLPTPEFDLSDRGTCDIPADTDSSFPQTLADTGCYSTLATREIVGAAIPFNINSILWTDDAYKRRYILLPEGETMTFSEHSEFDVPVGTIVIKEFYLESVLGDASSRVPVETRFLVKRCTEEEACMTTPWQGYSYQWNSGGNNGTLLSNVAAEDVPWPVTGQPDREHQYPSRAQCVECHNAAGRMLGVIGAQLNRPQEYNGVIANQIRALSEAGLFGNTAPTEEAEDLDRLPSPPDVSRSLEERSLAYFQSNCSHCHRPGGTNGAIDFRYYGPGLQALNICDKLTEGNPDVLGQIYSRDSSREALQMPPIATNIRDTQQLPVTYEWIDTMLSCP